MSSATADLFEAPAASVFEPIERFAGEHDWLSNMYQTPCEHEGFTYASSEHLYQALKVPKGWWRDKIATAEHPKIAKKLAGNPKCSKTVVEDFDAFRLELMEIALRAKFEGNSDLKLRLIETGERPLAEGNTWGDRFWGVCRGTGMNHLGQLLMKLRTEYAVS